MNIKKIVSMVLSCAVLAVSVLSVGASAAADRPTFGPFTTYRYYASGTMLYKYTTGIDTNKIIDMTLDGKNYINKIAMDSKYAKEASTYACIYQGRATGSRFSNNFLNGPATSTTLNKGEIYVSVETVYTVSGDDAMPFKMDTESSKNWASVKAGSMLTSSSLTSYGYFEYQQGDKVLFNHLSTFDY